MCICIDVFIVVTYSPSSKILLLVFAAKLRFASIWIPVCINPSLQNIHFWFGGCKSEKWKGQQIGQPLRHVADLWQQVQPWLQPPNSDDMFQLYQCIVKLIITYASMRVSVESVCLARSYLEEILPTARAIREKLPAKYGTKKPQSYRKYWAIDIIRSQNYSKSSCICYTPRRSFISLQTQNDTGKCLEFTPSSWPARTAKNPVVPTTVKREPASIAERYFTIWVVV